MKNLRRYSIALTLLFISLVLVSSVLAQDESPADPPPPCPVEADTAVGCPTFVLPEGVIADFYLGDTLLGNGNRVQTQIEAGTSHTIDVKNIVSKEENYGVLFTYDDTIASVYLRDGQSREYSVTPRKTYIRGTLAVTCDIRQLAETDVLGCTLIVDEVPQAGQVPAGESAELILDPGSHTILVTVAGENANLWSPETNEHTPRVTAGRTSTVRSTFNKKAHITVNFDTENVTGDILLNGDVVATQVSSYEAWVEPNKSYRVGATNFIDPAAEGIYTYRDASGYSYLRPGQEGQVSLRLQKVYIKGFLSITCEISNYNGENAYCQPAIDEASVAPIPAGQTVEYPIDPGRHDVVVVLGPVGQWFSEADSFTPYINVGRTTTHTSTFNLLPDVPATAQAGQVTRIVDGDTIDVRIGSETFRVRYIGIDTPERGQVCYNDATRANSNLVSRKTVILVRDVSETDQFGRLLRYVYFDGVFVNAKLVEDGYAQAADYPPDTAFSGLFHGLQDQARAGGRGCWGTTVWQPTPVPTAVPAACNCSGPDLDCRDFSTERQATECLNYCLSTVGYDYHRLDGDNDGRACESLP